MSLRNLKWNNIRFRFQKNHFGHRREKGLQKSETEDKEKSQKASLIVQPGDDIYLNWEHLNQDESVEMDILQLRDV